ncbi:MAG: hypothetical protein P9L95_00020 [Candidatus Tenebribacter mawsonii]|nr:hypothetical protein [Candidatus Tenebribacter mawsonii]
MKRKFHFGLFILIILFVNSCSTIEIITSRVPINFELIKKIQTNFIPQKCLYSSINKTVFVWENETDLIHIYSGENKINTIGGLGFNSQSFNKLADITLAPDGNLLALDSFQKKIKKFDVNGKLIAEISLTDFVEPSLFAVAIDETYYIYDNASKEIVITRTFDRSDWYSFGKFQLNTPSNLSLGKNEITVYEPKQNATMIFGILGRFQKEFDGNVKIEKQQNYILKDHFIYHQETEGKFAISTNTWNEFSIKDNVILLSDNEIWIGEFTYSKLNDK